MVTRLFTPEVGAAAFRQRVLADSFHDLGWDVEVLTTTPPAAVETAQPPADGALRISRWPALRDENGNIRGYLQYLSFDVPALVRLLVRRPPALVVAEPPPTTGVVVRLAALVQRRPYAYYAADVWSDGAASMGAPAPLVKALRVVESWVLRGAALVLSVSEGVTERVVGMGVPPERVVVVGNGIDTRVFRPSGSRPEEAAPYFAYTGTMSEWQGADVFVRALAIVRQTRPDARIVFLGQGSELSRLKALAAAEVPGAVDFPGIVPPEDAAHWLRGAAAALVSIKPGLGYDFAKPTKIYAATGCGTPVVFAGRGAGQELVLAERLGWAPGYDVQGVAEAMTEALAAPSDEGERTRLATWTEDNASLVAAARKAAEAVLRAARVVTPTGS